jgi:UDP-glucose 4-epimerase
MEILDSVLVSKDVPVDPTSPCELLNTVGGQHVKTYAELYCIDAVGLRYFNVYGVGQTGGDYSGVILICVD